MNLTIIGTGYVGLVTGACFSEMGNNVICADIDKNKIKMLKKGETPIYENGLSKLIKKGVQNGLLKFTTDLKKSIKNSNIIFITVGTPQNDDGSSDLKFVENVAVSIGKFINEYKIIVTKSTIPVGTTKKVKSIINHEIKKRKIKLDFDIANNPEFLKEGKAVDDFLYPDRIIVGIKNDKIKKVFRNLYKPFSLNYKKLIFMDIESSELTKYASNAMLATKISFMNEMSIIAEKVDANINLVREGIGSDPRIGYSFIYPSVGYGGSCFPKDVQSIINFSNKNGYFPSIINAVHEVNLNQKKYFFNKILKRFSIKNSLSGLQFGIWGLSFKPGTDDMRESASIYIINEIVKLGGSVKVFDPKAMKNAKKYYFQNLNSVYYCKDKYDALNGSSALVLLTEWPEFRSPDFKIIKERLKIPLIFDGRNQYSEREMIKMKFEYYQIGSSQRARK